MYELVPSNMVDETLLQYFKRDTKYVADHILEKQQIHKKNEVRFIAVNTKKSDVDLSELYGWLKFANIDEKDVQHISSSFKCSVFQSPFVNGFLIAKALTNVDECNLFIKQSAHSLQMKVVNRKGAEGKTLIGIIIYISNTCLECKAPASESVKLRKCGRCYHNHKARVLYCSKECQSKDYSRHRSVCSCTELLEDDWRKYEGVACDW
jgi:hypothetical protein